MRKIISLVAFGLGWVLATHADSGGASVPVPVDFSAQISPVISKKCYHCHGPDEGTRKAGLRLDSFAEATRERKGRRAIVPGDAAASELLKRIRSHDPDEVMPPPELKATVTPAEAELLERWIAQGANYTRHWAWAPPERPPLPAVERTHWPRNGVDHFILAGLEQRGLQPSREADRHTLIRRLSLDLTGLPPTPEDMSAFVHDNRPDAYEQLVDRLLDSPHFGERWARVWLDLARYADSAGYGSDPLRPNIWPWRDWLIGALNRNQPFDEFTRDLLAGDLLPDATEEQRMATAFHRNTMTNTEGGTDDEEWRVAAIKDRAGVTAQVWMGLTMNCAQCHSHKFDPISHQEYYSFYAFFNQSTDNDQPDERPTMPVYTAAQKERRAELQAEIAALKDRYLAPNEAFDAELTRWAEAAARPVAWTTLRPSAARSTLTNGASLAVLDDGTVLAHGGKPERDTYTLTVQPTAGRITALRLEVLPDDSLPKSGPGRAKEGQFVLNDLRAELIPAQPESVGVRFVRVEAPGNERILSLAEVQVFSAGRNVAPEGTATQSSTGYLGDANRAIDGNTDGSYDTARSTTHTSTESDPWWELDLGRELPVESVALWNRTDGNTGSRLANSRLRLLDARRAIVWEGDLKQAPSPVATLGPGAPRALALRNASADYAQPDFPPGEAIDADAGRNSGWAVGGQLGQAHQFTVELVEPLDLEAGATLTLSLAQNYGGQHTLGRFRLSVTGHETPVRIYPRPIAAALAATPEQRTDEHRRALAEFHRPDSRTLGPVARELAAREADLMAIRGTPLPVMQELATGEARTTRILNKGNFLDPGETVQPGVPRAFHPWPQDAPLNRLGLAQWLTAPDNPLTARVFVNRFWGQLLGRPLVETEEDFGTQGTLPANRPLLDWLAVAFQARNAEPLPQGSPPATVNDPAAPALGWDFKALLKLIVTSATYRQASAITPELLAKDPLNEFHSRAGRRRLDAETVRDQALALSGLLSRRLGGPSVYPMQPDGLWRAAFNGERNWATSPGEDRYRRGIYTFWRRTVPYPSMSTFDAPSRETCTLRRQPTNTPLQAFVTLNDPSFVECAQALGRRLAALPGSVADRVRAGLELVLARPADAAQVKTLTGLFEAELAGYRDRPEEARDLATVPLGPLPPSLSASEAAAWTTLGNVLLNLDGVLSRN